MHPRMEPRLPVGNEKSRQSTMAVTEHLTESEMSAARTKTGTERGKRTRKGRTIRIQGEGSMKRTDTAHDMEGKIMTATEGNIEIGTETATIIVMAVGGIVTLDATGKRNYASITP